MHTLVDTNRPFRLFAWHPFRRGDVSLIAVVIEFLDQQLEPVCGIGNERVGDELVAADRRKPRDGGVVEGLEEVCNRGLYNSDVPGLDEQETGQLNSHPSQPHVEQSAAM